MGEEVKLNQEAIEAMHKVDAFLHPKAEEQEAGPLDPASILYPSMGKAAKQQVKPSGDKSHAEILYGDKTDGGRNPTTTDDGHTLDCIKNVGGKIMIQASYGGDLVSMAARHNTELNEADLSGYDLAGKNMSGSRMRNASLVNADLEGTSLRDSILLGADFSGADLKNADLRMCNLRAAVFSAGTNIEGCDFQDSEIDEAAMTALTQCRGFHAAKNLKYRADHKEHPNG